MKTRNKKILTVIAMVLITLLAVSPGLYAKSLNPKSQGNWVTLQIDLTGFSNLKSVNAGDITLNYKNDSIKAEKIHAIGNKQKTARFLVKFSRAELIQMLEGTSGDVSLTVKAKGREVKDFTLKMAGPGKGDPGKPYPDNDTIAPKIQSSAIANYTLTLTYNENLDEESVPAPEDFSVYAGSELIKEADYVDIDRNKVLLLLHENIEAGVTVKISYTPGTDAILDLAGNEAAAFNLLAVTNMSSQATPPGVIATIPQDQVHGVSIDDNVTVFFNEDIQAGSKVSLISFNGETGDFSYRILDNKLILNPNDDFAYHTKYTVVIPVGAVEDLDGNDNNLTWRFSFTTGGPEPNYLSAGTNHSAAREDDGHVFVWGAYDNLHEVSSPALVTSLEDVIAVSSGSNYTLALKDNGTVWAWGDNGVGQLGSGDDDLAYRNTPAKVVGPEGSGYLTDIVAIAAGDSHALALSSNGTVWAWGDNSSGQLGNGDNDYKASFVPVQVQNKNATGSLTGIKDIDCGYEHSIALGEDGTVWTWGSNEYSQLGIHPGIKSCVVPVQVVGIDGTGSLTGVKAVDAGGFYNISLKNDETVFSWGLNSDGQLGNNSSLERSYKPVQVLFPSSISIVSLSAGGYVGHSLAIDKDGFVWAWGDNAFGQLGNGTYRDNDIPVKISDLDNILEISAGGEDGHSIALDENGKVWTWGSNLSGQLGRDLNDDDQSSYPVKILDLDLILE